MKDQALNSFKEDNIAQWKNWSNFKQTCWKHWWVEEIWMTPGANL